MCVLVGTICACQVPVFRYALERWEPDPYELLVLHEGPLSEDAQAALSYLEKQASQVDTATFSVADVAIDDSTDPAMRKLWRENSPKGDPVLAVLYPSQSQVPSRLAFCEPLSKKSVEHVLSSPVRDSLVRELQDGDSAVWIFVPCGDKPKDDAAYQTLQEQLAKDAQWITLPSPEELEVPAEVIKQSKIELRIDFGIVRLDRDDPREKFTLDALLNSESDLKEFDEPMAFPVFGRGRVLYALIGKGISAETIRSATSFITGPCSCQVKNQNPGFDMLILNDWDKALGDVLISEPIPTVAQQPQLLTIPPGRSKTGP